MAIEESDAESSLTTHRKGSAEKDAAVAPQQERELFSPDQRTHPVRQPGRIVSQPANVCHTLTGCPFVAVIARRRDTTGVLGAQSVDDPMVPDSACQLVTAWYDTGRRRPQPEIRGCIENRYATTPHDSPLPRWIGYVVGDPIGSLVLGGQVLGVWVGALGPLKMTSSTQRISMVSGICRGWEEGDEDCIRALGSRVMASSSRMQGMTEKLDTLAVTVGRALSSSMRRWGVLEGRRLVGVSLFADGGGSGPEKHREEKIAEESADGSGGLGVAVASCQSDQ